jgi:hypothetical protein
VGSSPQGIAFDGANIWVANAGNDTVSKLSRSPPGHWLATPPITTHNRAGAIRRVFFVCCRWHHPSSLRNPMNRILVCFAFIAFTFASACNAETPQTFSAQVGDIAFASGDAEITLVPIGSSFNLNASTSGASAYPPPKTRLDRFSIVCDGFVEGKPVVLDHKVFERSTCSVTFEKGYNPMGGNPEATYKLDKNSADNRFEIVAANGKVYEGRFTFRLKDEKGNAVAVNNGSFKAEDRQL